MKPLSFWNSCDLSAQTVDMKHPKLHKFAIHFFAMRASIPIFLFLAFSALFSSCRNQKVRLSTIEGQQIRITDSIPKDDSITAFIAPYKEHIAREMDSVLAYAPNDLDKTDGDLNTAIGNMMADAVMELSNPVFKKRTGRSIDMVLLNHGGIRSPVNQGKVTTRTAYQLMPFENEVVVAALKGQQIKEIINYLIEGQTPHPISGMELVIDENNRVIRATVQGKPIEDEKTYYVATNDYLYQGGDNMIFFSKAQDVMGLDYKIRNLLIDYFKRKDTIAPQVDQRFIRQE